MFAHPGGIWNFGDDAIPGLWGEQMPEPELVRFNAGTAFEQARNANGRRLCYPLFMTSNWRRPISLIK